MMATLLRKALTARWARRRLVERLLRRLGKTRRQAEAIARRIP